MSVEEMAQFIAYAAHKNQWDRMGRPYFEHVRAVANLVKDFGPDYEAAALLHDVLEDTDVTVKDMLAAGIPGDVVQTVYIVTRRDGESYAEFIERIVRSGDLRAVRVKLADLTHNLLPERSAGSTASLRARYLAAVEVLRNAIQEGR